MQTQFPIIGQRWRDDLMNRRYGFLLSDNPMTQMHKHRFFELGYLVRGEIDHEFHGTLTHMKAGDFYFVDIGVSHRYHGTDDTEVLNFMFYPEAIDPSFSEYQSLTQITASPFFRFTSDQLPLLTHPCFHDEDGKLLQLLENLQDEITERRPGHHQMIHAMIQQLVIRLLRADNDARQAAEESGLINEVLRMIEERYTTDLTVKEIAKELGYSAVHISRLFKETQRIPFTDYLQRYRISKSCGYLARTDWSIAKVAEAVGYGNVQFYHRLFRRFQGTTPLQYRKLRRKL